MMSSREFNAQFLLLTKINKEHRSHLLLQMSVKAVSKAEDQKSFTKKDMLAATTLQFMCRVARRKRPGRSASNFAPAPVA